MQYLYFNPITYAVFKHFLWLLFLVYKPRILSENLPYTMVSENRVIIASAILSRASDRQQL